GIRRKAIDRDQWNDAELSHVLDMALQIAHPGFERTEILVLEVFFLDAAVHFQRANSGDEYNAIGREAGLAAFDIEKLFGAEIRAEARLGDDIVGKLERRGGGEHRVAAVGDVGERTAVNESGGALG